MFEWMLWRHGQCNYTASSEIFHPDGAQTGLLVTRSFRVLPLTQILRMTHMELISISPANDSLPASKNIQIHKFPDNAVYATASSSKFDYMRILQYRFYNILVVFFSRGSMRAVITVS